MYLDLAEVDELFRGRLLWSSRWPALAWFRRGDYMPSPIGEPKEDLADSVRRVVHDHTGDTPTGSIRLLTHPRYLGFVMNPVSFYFCFHSSDDEDAETLSHVVAEVTNTPWGERHCYVMSAAELRSDAKRIPKVFHVSPFMNMAMNYRWLIDEPGEQLTAHLENFQLRDAANNGTENGNKAFFDVTMQLRRQDITTRSLATTLLRFPLMTQRVWLAIYWQALKLWWKGVPFSPHPRKLAPPATSVQPNEIEA